MRILRTIIFYSLRPSSLVSRPSVYLWSDQMKSFNSQGAEIFPFSYFENPWLECDLAIKDMKIYIISIKLELMVLISGEKVVTEIITWRRNNDFHFSPKGKNGVQNAICPPGVNCISLVQTTGPYRFSKSETFRRYWTLRHPSIIVDHSNYSLMKFTKIEDNNIIFRWTWQLLKKGAEDSNMKLKVNGHDSSHVTENAFRETV